MGADTEVEEHYRSVLASGVLGDDACVTWCRGRSVDEVARLLGGRRDEAEFRTLGEAVNDALEADGSGETIPPPVALIGVLGDWTVAVEPYGCQGIRPMVLRALSENGGRALSVKWNVDLDTGVSYAADGRQEAVPYPSNRADSSGGQDSRAAPALLKELDGSPESGFVLAERMTGRRLRSEWFSQRHLRIFVIDPIRGSHPWIPEAAHGHPMLEEPGISAMTNDLTPGGLPAIAVAAARIAVRESGLDGVTTDPVIAAALGALDHRPPARELEGLRERLVATADELRARALRAPDGDEAGKHDEHSRAVRAVAAALGPDPLAAAYEAVMAARRLRGLDVETRLRISVLAACVNFIHSQGAVYAS